MMECYFLPYDNMVTISYFSGKLEYMIEDVSEHDLLDFINSKEGVLLTKLTVKELDYVMHYSLLNRDKWIRTK
jgi:hypothetical protein